MGFSHAGAGGGCDSLLRGGVSSTLHPPARFRLGRCVFQFAGFASGIFLVSGLGWVHPRKVVPIRAVVARLALATKSRISPGCLLRGLVRCFRPLTKGIASEQLGSSMCAVRWE